MADKYKRSQDYWLHDKALNYLLTWVINTHSKDIKDNHLFLLVHLFAEPGEVAEEIRASFTPAEIKEMEEYSPRIDRLDFTDHPAEMLREVWCASRKKDLFHKMLGRLVARQRARRPKAARRESPVAAKAREIQATFQLTDLEMDILLVSLLIQNNSLHARNGEFEGRLEYISQALDRSLSTIREHVRADKPLRQYGCLDCSLNSNPALAEFLTGERNEPLSESYFRRYKGEVLPIGFFDDTMSRHGEMLRAIINTQGDGPVNILLYGRPGTGKTSFAHSLSASLGRVCYDVLPGKGSDSLFSGVSVASRHVPGSTGLLVVDEADVLFQGTDRRGGREGVGVPYISFQDDKGDKGTLNTIMDSLKVPAIWITNSLPGDMDESNRRRFDYSIHFPPLSYGQRLAVWRNCVGRAGVGHLVDDAMMEGFANKYEVSAGVISLALRNLAKVSPVKEDVRRAVDQLMRQHCEILQVDTRERLLLPVKDYSLEGLSLRGDVPLGRVVDAIKGFKSKPMDTRTGGLSLLLTGPPGTGKTEFVKYLGKEVGAKLQVRMGSDLLSMWVGGTERNIRAAFDDAEREDAILFLDEIDGLVQSRERAVRSWEVTQVNELLHRMESFRGVVVGATNFAVNLDAAMLRRFVFKLEFDFLDNKGKEIFFHRMFNTRLSRGDRERLVSIQSLTPGDFHTARRAFQYLGGKVTNTMRLDALEDEVRCKRQNRYAVRGSRMGFN